MPPLLVATLALAGCVGSWGDRAVPPPQGEAAAEPPAVEAVEARGLVGRVTWSGPAQSAPTAAVTEDPCAAAAGAAARSVGPEAGLADVVVVVADAPASVDALRSFELRASGCRFQPAVAAVPVGTQLVANNRDARLHTFHLRREQQGGSRRNLHNLAVPPGEHPAFWLFDEPATVHISSDQVPAMEAWVLVLDGGQSTVSDAEGRFELPLLPPGQWQVRFWHPRFGQTELPVLIPADGPASLYASLPPSP